MLTRNEWEAVNHVINGIYRTKSLTAMRRQFLRDLSHLIQFHFSDFALGQLGLSAAPNLVDTVVCSAYPADFEQRFIGQYESVFFEFDYVKWVFSSPVSLVYRESDLINAEARRSSKFYVEYLKPFGFEHLIGVSVISEEPESHFLGSVTLYRTGAADDFSDKELYILKQLSPHLQNRLEAASEKKAAAALSASYVLKARYALTPREIQIATLIAQGAVNQEIATALGIAENTVKKHISHVFDKLQVKNRTLLTRFMLENKMI